MKQVSILFSVALLLLIGGCKSAPSMKPLTVHVQIDRGVDHGFTMDFIPVGAADQEPTTVDVNRYFDPASPTLRDGILEQARGISRTFRPGEVGSFEIIQASDGRWREWRRDNVMDMVIMVNRFAVETAAGDEREVVPQSRKRIAVPLDRRRWGQRDKEITIHVQRARMSYRPQPKPLD